MGEQEALVTIKNDVEQNPVFLYMKGTPEAPQCGFSAQIVQILKSHNITFNSRNVLEDWDIREGVKKFTNWPTVPQLYVKGQFIGGSDIIADMNRKGELATVFQGV
ncbi:MAG: Grx4 family monothiol glutaredoxin [Chitinophagaceae bacterium]|nr:Grx4 family monothiol glutaredoxin [Oligoflexus sp.]